MHPNRIFHTESDQHNLEFARARGFGTLAVSTQDAPLLSHIPFVVSDDSTFIELHVVRSNPIARLLDKPLAAKLSILGPDSYISPDWYDLDDQVPTWNYIAVHVTGTLIALPDEDLRGVLERLSAHFENQLLPKPPWRMEKMNSDALEKMLRAIMPCRLDIAHIDGTWKLNQNKPAGVRLRAADHIVAAGVGAEVEALAEHQRAVG